MTDAELDALYEAARMNDITPTPLIRYANKPGWRAALWRYAGMRLARSQWVRRGVDEQRLYLYDTYQGKGLYITEDELNRLRMQQKEREH